MIVASMLMMAATRGTSEKSALRGSYLDARNASFYPHSEVYEHVLAAFNKQALLPSLVNLFDDGGSVAFCHPYPNCVEGKDAIEAALKQMNNSLLDTYMVPTPLTPKLEAFAGFSGGFFSPTTTQSLPPSNVENGGCLIGSPQYIQWDFVEGEKKLRALNVFFDEAIRFKQASDCAAADVVASVVMGDGSEHPRARLHLTSLANDMIDTKSANPSTEAWVDGWVDLFADNPEVQQCDPYGISRGCTYGRQDIRERFASFQKSLSSTLLFLVSGGGSFELMVSKNFGFGFNTYSATHKETGCILNHVQFFLLQLDDADTRRLKSMKIFYNPTRNFHDCNH